MPYKAELYYQAYQEDDPTRLPLVFIHGAGGNRLSWPGQLRRLSGYRVYTPDLPGHGKSTGHGLQRIADYGTAAAEWMHRLEVPRIFLVGHSMGGAIALWLGVHHPELIRGLILISTGSQLPVKRTLLDDLAAPGSYPSFVDRIVRWSFSPDAPAQVREGVRQALANTRPSVLEGDFLACDTFDLSGNLGDVHAPTLILMGELDKMTPPRFGEELAEGIPQAELELIPGAGHMLPLEAPDQVEDQLRSFLKRSREDGSIA